MDFSSKLKELRQQRDISLRKLGEKASISYSILNSIENGRFQPSKEIVISLAYALRVENVEELLVLAGYPTTISTDSE
ncbi:MULTISPECIES: helix-turn-helix domain-containing protein [unclassified Paenibacillus]|uniref:helix-turn-helix domain-containing protein n=1 Tax=unclassified Paenibacillus TaxID=185978 RepID=UPI00363FA834